ncbi:MAG: hypothetical protein ABJO29_03210 [Yoonia sp.]|uniref:hypothetical protein n=1 Tax=Yoonia sp. TaxID=2212373 RepID=UPI003264A7BC
MQMKRRGFLTMFGAAIAAPALPMAAPAPAAAVYSRYMYGLAVFHARTRAHVSARGLALGLKVSTTQAEAMIAEMTANGLVKSVGFSGGNVRAVSNILKPDAWGLDKAARTARSTARKAKQAARAMELESDLSPLTVHLHQICRKAGYAVHGLCTPCARNSQADFGRITYATT